MDPAWCLEVFRRLRMDCLQFVACPGGRQWVTHVSPVFVTLLLTRISGVSMLEERADDW